MLLYVTAYGGNRLYRNDDAVVTTNGGFPHVLLNQTATANHWLTVDLTGRRSNRDAIGAEITVTTGHRTQLVTVSTCGSYLSASDKRAHFGLGSATVVNTLDIQWPSGLRQHLENVKADQFLKIDEPSQSPRR
jgi:enediyne biosynthesis protein E4